MFNGFLQPTHLLLLMVLGGAGYVAFLVVRILRRVEKRGR